MMLYLASLRLAANTLSLFVSTNIYFLVDTLPHHFPLKIQYLLGRFYWYLLNSTPTDNGR
jgi:hypothetical protein